MSNVFKQMEFMPGASLDELTTKAVDHATKVLSGVSGIPGMTIELMTSILCGGIRIGVLGDGEIDDTEKTMIKEFFNAISEGAPVDALIKFIDQPLDERAYKIVADLFDISMDLGMQFCNLIMCFAYADGVFEDEVSQKLSDIVTSKTNVVVGEPF